MRFLYFGAALALLDSFEETLFIQPITDYLRDDMVFAQFDFSIRSLRAPTDDSMHFDLFPKSVGKILSRLDVKEFKAILTQGRWKDSWGEQPVNVYPPGATMFSDGTQWRELCPALAGIMSASFEAMTVEHPSYRWIQPATTPWLRGQFSSMPYEATCTENLTSLLKLLPCKGKSGLASLLEAIAIAESPFKSVQISGKRDENGLTFCGTLQVVLPKAHLTQNTESCIAADKSTVWVRLPEHIEVGTQAYKQDGWVLHSVPLEQWPGKIKIPSMQAAGVPVALEPKRNERIFVERDILSKPGKSERTHGIYSLRLQSKHKTSIRFTDQLPWFIQPLWSTMDVTIGDQRLRGTDAAKAIKLQLNLRSDAKSPSFFHLEVPSDKPVSFRVEVLKSHVSSKEFFAGCEKGFDLAAAAWQDDIGVFWPATVDSTPCVGCPLKNLSLTTADDLHFTEGLLVMVPMPDFSMPFNVIAVSSSVLALFYAMLSKATMQGIE
eukprot:GEMP01023476.1.p1 GENE.GEMP01023476.1~~GEMP01023476.1.p1  ORF type:complete len:493 (+),score=98.67 GEMP01023476.1:30-1508(+)